MSTISAEKPRHVGSMSRRRKVGTVVYHVIVAALSIGMLYPLMWLVASSFKPNNEIFVTVNLSLIHI